LPALIKAVERNLDGLFLSAINNYFRNWPPLASSGKLIPMTPREEMDLLLRVTSQLAQKQLETGGRMHFGSLLGPSRNVQVLMPKEMKKNATWDELIAYWRRELPSASSKMAWRALSFCTFLSGAYDDGTRGTALLIHLEHADSSVVCEDITFGYVGEPGGKITLSQPTKAVGERLISCTGSPSQV